MVSRLINADVELDDLEPEGRRAYVDAQRWIALWDGIAIGIGFAGIVITVAMGHGLVGIGFVVMLGVAIHRYRNPDEEYGLAKGRLAEMPPPPEPLSWEEHVKKYGHRDGEPLTDAEERALINGHASDLGDEHA
ncbi:hypothetical protein HUG10_21015 (plasmid) [Halorarum halophilum]|uniref:Uncharacterized protein n=1 Tax=Halorarum halophilum TaxID=2743090 RepID=A0A7D5H040_9EURY|nr:hypothetical protein [Halobaculum halophilum]QLG30069.1 hypothetical protein HUG10_21015 [Halobaculum halophilum]